MIGHLSHIKLCFAIFSIVASLSSCIKPVPQFSDDAYQRTEVIFLQDQANEPYAERAFEEAAAIGTLALIDNCLGLQGSKSSPGTVVVWPPEYRLQIEGDSIELVDQATGEFIASLGNEIQIGGGFHHLGDAQALVQAPLPQQCADDEYFLATPTLEVIEP